MKEKVTLKSGFPEDLSLVSKVTELFVQRLGERWSHPIFLPSMSWTESLDIFPTLYTVRRYCPSYCVLRIIYGTTEGRREDEGGKKGTSVYHNVSSFNYI